MTTATELARTPERVAALPGQNLLINGDFGVWQRGAEFITVPVDTYTADRWKTVGLTNVQHVDQGGPNFENAPIITIRTGSQWAGIGQIIEGCARTLSGNKITISMLIKGISGDLSQSYLWIRWTNSSAQTSGKSVEGFQGFADTSGSWRKVEWTVTAPLRPSGEYVHLQLRIHLTGTPITTTEVKAQICNVKLELGSVATPFIPDDPATNLMKCQRYYFKPSQHPRSTSNGQAYFPFIINFPVTLRAVPSIYFTDQNNTANKIQGDSLSLPAYVRTIGTNQVIIDGNGTVYGANVFLHARNFHADAEL